MNIDEFQGFTQYLEDFSAANRRKALREVVQFLMRSNKKRLKANIQPSGRAMVSRRHGNRKMFQQLGKSLKKTVKSDAASIGYFGRVGEIATNHQLGRNLKRQLSGGRTQYIDLPIRELLGLDEEDRHAVNQIFIKHLMVR